MKILTGDCLEVMRTLEENSVDAVVTDPPYGWHFMGKAWDDANIMKLAIQGKRPGETYIGADGIERKTRNQTAEAAGKYDLSLSANHTFELWTAGWAKEAFRILKPGGHMLVFCGPRTYHRMASGVEDAGFEIRDQLQWLFGSGFPKSHNISKAIDKSAGAEREVGINLNVKGRSDNRTAGQVKAAGNAAIISNDDSVTAPATPDAIKYEGWGTALKPANEPIVLARKPLSEKTVALNVLKWGCGAINIDGSRIGSETRFNPQKDTTAWHGNSWSGKPQQSNGEIKTVQGRWPANVIFDEEAALMLDEQTSGIHGAGSQRNEGTAEQTANGGITSYQLGQNPRNGMRFGDSGGASRFFYCAKASKSERNKGLENEKKEKQGARPNSQDETGKFPDHDHRPSGGNNHPTVKPVKLIEYLCRLITPPGGLILDPFVGSGTCGVAAKNLGFNFIGIEMNPEYVAIAKKRIAHAKDQMELAL